MKQPSTILFCAAFLGALLHQFLFSSPRLGAAKKRGAKVAVKTSPNKQSTPDIRLPEIHPRVPPEISRREERVSKPSRKRRTIRETIALFQSEDSAIRRGAAFALLKRGIKTIPFLEFALEDPCPQVRSYAAYTLGLMGEKAAAANYKLTLLLGDSKPELRKVVIHSLSKIGESAVCHLELSLRDPSPQVRSYAAYTLGLMGEKAAAASYELTLLLSDPKPEVRSHASIALTRLGIKSLPDLIPCLSSNNPTTREYAVHALGEVRENAPEIIPKLLFLLEDSNPGVRLAATLALSRLGAPAIPILISGINLPQPEQRLANIQALGLIGDNAKQAIPALTLALNDENSHVKLHAQIALEKIENKGLSTRSTYTLKQSKILATFNVVRQLDSAVQQTMNGFEGRASLPGGPAVSFEDP